MVTVFHYTPINAKQFDRLNIDGLAGKHQKYQNFSLSKFCAIRYLLSFASYRLECNEYNILVNLYSLKSLLNKKYITILSCTLKDTLRHEVLVQKLSL